MNEEKTRWASEIVGRYVALEQLWNDRPAFRCRIQSASRASELGVVIYFAPGPAHPSGWWISHGWDGPSQTLWCAKDANLPPASGWIDPDGAPAPAGFTVSVDEDGRAADVFIDRPRTENPEMGGDKGMRANGQGSGRPR